MQRGTKSELQMLRELAWWVLPYLECEFCHEPILRGPQGGMSFGHRRHPPLDDTRFTIHHRDRDRDNNTRLGLVTLPAIGAAQMNGNVVIAHKRCHTAYHANERRTNEPDEPDSE
jgi:hypothetical protein